MTAPATRLFIPCGCIGNCTVLAVDRWDDDGLVWFEIYTRANEGASLGWRIKTAARVLAALERMRSAWQKTQDQQVLDLDPADPGLDETRATSPIPPPGGRARLVEPEGSSGSGASPTPARDGELSPRAGGSSFRQDACEAIASRVPGSRHLHVVPDPRVPTPIPLPRLLEVLTWTP